MEFHVIGAGIAGLSAAYSLAKENHKVHVYEKEQLPCMFSSSRNAAIFRTYESDPSLSLLVKESYRQLVEIEKEAGPLMDRRGLLIDPLELDYYDDEKFRQWTVFNLDDFSYAMEPLEPDFVKQPRGNFENTYSFRAIMLKHNGVMDIHAWQNFLVKKMALKGVVFHYNHCVENFNLQNEKIAAIEFKNEDAVELSPGDVVINAAGSWAADLVLKALSQMQAQTQTLPVRPYKRHLFFLRKTNREFSGQKLPGSPGFQKPSLMPVLWNEKRDVYIRPESDGFLATHCDQREVSPGDYSADEKEVHRFLESVLSVFPFLKDHHISRYWACLRTFSLDQMPVVGFDPFIKNLFWVAGLGGRGITMSPGMIPLVHQLVFDETAAANNPFSPGRFY